jgi:hypothetical protein
MSRKIYNRLSFMAVSWLDESTLLFLLPQFSVGRESLYCIYFPARALVTPSTKRGTFKAACERVSCSFETKGIIELWAARSRPHRQFLPASSATEPLPPDFADRL